MNLWYQIKINGISRRIMSYDRLLQLEQGLINNGAGPLTDIQYLSALFFNLGYEKCPSTIGKILDKDLYDVQKDTVFDFRITNRPLYLKDEDTLHNLIECIKIWIYGKSENGYLVDMNNSFQLPDTKTIIYDLENQIEIKRTLKTFDKYTKWFTTDFYTRRLHNLSPNINPMYANRCIRKFKEYAKQIKIKNCHILFKVAIVNPDVVYTTIRNSEMTAADIVDKQYGGYSSLRPDYDTALEFINQLKIRIQAIINIYNRNGLKGFLDEFESRKISNPNYKEALAIVDWEEAFLNDEQKRMDFINNMKLTGDIKKRIYSLVDKKLFPPEMVWAKCCNSKDMADRYKLCYEPTMRALSYVTEYIVHKYEDADSETPKLSLSRSFYINPTIFAIYWKEMDLVFIVDAKYNIYEMTPKEGVDFYKKYYKLDIRLDPDEFGKESVEPVEPSNVNSEANKIIEAQKNGIKLEDTSYQQFLPVLVQNPQIQEQNNEVNNTAIETSVIATNNNSVPISENSFVEVDSNRRFSLNPERMVKR